MTEREKALQWENHPGMPRQLIDELRALSDAEITDRFYRDLAFGTGGLRALMGAGTNRINVYTIARATTALADFLLEHTKKPRVAIGYDTRNNSAAFAHLTAAVLAECGVSAYLNPECMPTPMLSFAVRRLHCDAGVMITASHNPAAYNGYKVYRSDGGQITLGDAAAILEKIEKRPLLRGAFPAFDAHLRAKKIVFIEKDVVREYYETVHGLLIHPPAAPLNVVYSPLNGTGAVPVAEILRRMGGARVSVVKEQYNPDGNFPTCPFPNPELPEAMALSVTQTLREKADICLATDPDCDRVGVGVRQGDHVTLLSGNEVGVLLLEYLCRNKAPNMPKNPPPVAVKTIVTTGMADVICQKYGVELRSVLTGFKFIGEQIGALESNGETDRFLFGFEESCGYLSGNHARDKDAVDAAMRICEMTAHYKAQGKTLLQALDALYQTYGYYAEKLLSFSFPGQSGMERMKTLMAALRGNSLKTLVFLDISGRTDYLRDETGLPKSDVLAFDFSNGARAIVRPSGTEPKIKAYLMAHAASARENARIIADLTQALTAFFGLQHT